MKKPNYTRYPIYQILEDLAHKAGLKIEYKKLKEGISGEYFKDERKIVMSDTNIYCNENDEDGGYNASFYLAHEMGHALIDEKYTYNEFDYEHDLVMYKIVDADADKVGGALFNLALMINNQNSKY